MSALGVVARTRRFSVHAGIGFQIGSFLLVAILLIGLVAPFFLPDPNATDVRSVLLPPSPEHLFGTDRYGRDVLARTVAAVRLDLALGVGIALVAMVIGSFIGVAAGFFGGWIDEVVMRLTDLLMAFPGFVFALMLSAFLGRGIFFTALGVTLASLPYFIRLTRSIALIERRRDSISAARLAGSRSLRIVVDHVLPNSLPPAIVQATIIAGWAMLDIAALSFLGLGVQPPTAEWGTMIYEGYGDILVGQWWSAVFPGIALLLSVLSFQLIGDGLDRAVRR